MSIFVDQIGLILMLSYMQYHSISTAKAHSEYTVLH